MANLNLFLGEGIIKNEPVTQYTNGSKPVCNFIVIIENSYKSKKNQNDEIVYKKRQAHIPVTAWAGKAEMIPKNYQKGDKIRITGRVNTINSKSSFELILDDIALIKPYYT